MGAQKAKTPFFFLALENTFFFWLFFYGSVQGEDVFQHLPAVVKVKTRLLLPM
jgi:hypothetical protein